MDYTILKTLEPPPSYLFNQDRRFNLPSNPHIDYVNPGVGSVTKLYDFYIPLHSQGHQHEIKKKDNNDDSELTKAENQEGKGNEDPIDRTDNETHQNTDNKSIAVNDQTSQGFLPKKRLSEGILDSFMHPKIKTAKLSFNDRQPFVSNDRQLSLSKNSEKRKETKKLVKHKFNVFD